MDALLKLGWLAGAGGALLCLVGVAARLGGAFWIGGFQTGTLLQAGTAVMVFACFCLLVVLTQRDRSR
jgi:hypothetical protein